MAVSDAGRAPGTEQPGDVRFERVDIGSDDARWAIAEYFGELDRRFAGGFDPAAGGAGHDGDRMSPPDGVFLVVRRGDGLLGDGDVIGCGGVQRIEPTVAEIKRMWVHPDRRGDGIGRRLLDELESAARSLGCDTVVLDTNATLEEAISLYERRGYESIERYNDNPYAQRWFRTSL